MEDLPPMNAQTSKVARHRRVSRKLCRHVRPGIEQGCHAAAGRGFRLMRIVTLEEHFLIPSLIESVDGAKLDVRWMTPWPISLVAGCRPWMRAASPCRCCRQPCQGPIF